MGETKILPVVEERAAEDGCCDPICGPDTCGCGPSAEMVETPKTKEKETATAAEQCCDPDCGPDTCG